MPFQSILFNHPETGAEVAANTEPAFFADLHLDQVLAAMTAGHEEYDLPPFFYVPLHDEDAVRYRHEVLRDLEQPAVREAVDVFALRMRTMREHLAQAAKLHHPYQRSRWFTDAVAIYGDAVVTLTQTLTKLDLRSRGLLTFRDYLTSYSASNDFTALTAELDKLNESLSGVRYCVHIKGSRVTVSHDDEEADYSAEVEAAFAKFKQGAVKDYRVKFPSWPEMDHVEGQVLDLVARLFPDIFQALADFCTRHQEYLDPVIGRFDREIQFYLSYLGSIARLKSAGLPFCYPEVSTTSKELAVSDGFDLVLATSLAAESGVVVRNDFRLTDSESVIVITGPNQGGKTTFARMFGQLHYLAALGLPVPAEAARLFLPDRLFTHFEREEDITTLRGKLEDELIRIHDILRQATTGSVIIMNESFTSTTLEDALSLGTAVMRQIIEIGALCIYVTFVDELAALDPRVVSMASTIVPNNPAERTYKIVRKPADGLAYAWAIAEKYGLTYDRLKERVAS